MKIKSLYITLILLISNITNIHAQVSDKVGINTTQPTKDLDINGNLKIRDLQDKSEDSQYNRILVSDENGNIESASRTDVKNQIESQIIETQKLKYLSTDADASQTMKCGRFSFRFSSSGYPQISLNDPDNTTIYYYILKSVYVDYSSYSTTQNLNFTISNYNTFQNMGSLEESQLGEYYITYPNVENYYKVIARIRKNYVDPSTSQTTNSYAITCEKF